MFYNRRREKVGVYIYNLKQTKKYFEICDKVWAKMSNHKKLLLRKSLMSKSLNSMLPVLGAVLAGMAVHKRYVKPLFNNFKSYKK